MLGARLDQRYRMCNEEELESPITFHSMFSSYSKYREAYKQLNSLGCFQVP